MRIRLPELMEARGLNAHSLAAKSGGRISITTAYRLVRMRGDFKLLPIIEALCDVLQVEPGELFEREPAKAPARKKAAAKGAKKRA